VCYTVKYAHTLPHTKDAIMTPPLRVLQIGAGARAQSHLAAMQACGAVEIVGLCELDSTRLAATADTFGIAARYSNMAQAIAWMQARGLF
jgi:predicted dehydrogenase